MINSQRGQEIREGIRQVFAALKAHDSNQPAETMELTIDILNHIRSWKAPAFTALTPMENP